MAKYRIGIIGFGKIAQDQHLPAIKANPDFELAALSSTKGLTDDYAQHTFTDWKKMIAETPDLHAVAICTPPGPRRDIARDCLAAGKSVLLEKPPAGTTAEVEDIARLAKAAGKVAFGTFHAQYNSGVDAAKAALAGKTVKRLEVVWKEDVNRWHPGQAWVFEAGGMGVFDPGINALSICTKILPAPIFVKTAELSFPANKGAPIAADLTFGSGAAGAESMTAVFDWRQTGPQTWDITVETVEGGTVKLTSGGSKLEVDGKVVVDAPEQEYPLIYKRFAELLDKGESELNAAPFRLLADAFMVGKRVEVDPFTAF